MNLYQKYILPYFLNFSMNKRSLEKYRADIVKNTSGIVLELGFGSGLNLPHYKNISKLYLRKFGFKPDRF